MFENENKPSEQELFEMLKKRQLEWVNDGNEWSKGFIQGIEYVLNLTSEQMNKY